ncbi:MAG: DUF1904 domain-containing protein [Clostridiaceae bacterium]
MPQLIVRGIKPEEVCKVSEKAIDEMVEVVKCPRDYFVIECIQSVGIKDGKVTESIPFIEVAWFDRGQEIQDQVAKIIDSNFRGGLNIENLDVIFTVLKEEKYYENGEHF